MSQRDTVFNVSVLNFKAIVQNNFLCRSSKYEVPANFLGGRESSVKHLEKHVGRLWGTFFQAVLQLPLLAAHFTIDVRNAW